ncbi:YncE family protein [Cupriavidus basilensis]
MPSLDGIKQAVTASNAIGRRAWPRKKGYRRPGRTTLALCAALACAACAWRAQTPASQPATAYVSSETGGIAVIDLGRLEIARTLDTGGKGPRGIGISADGRYLLAANKGTSDLSVIDTRDGQLVRRIPIGKNPEFVRVSGGQAFVTYEPGERNGPPGAEPAPAAGKPAQARDGAPVPAEIAVIDLKDWRVTRAIPSGLETEGIEFSPDARLLLVTNEGDDTVSVYERASGRRLNLLKTPPGSRPRGIKVSPDGRRYIVTLESANAFLVLDAADYRVLRTVPTRAGPTGSRSTAPANACSSRPRVPTPSRSSMRAAMKISPTSLRASAAGTSASPPTTRGC